MQLALSQSLAPAPGTSLPSHSTGVRRVQPGALLNGEGHAAVVLLSQPVWGCGAVFGVLGGSTPGGSCTWRNLFWFVPCFHTLCPPPTPAIDESRKICLSSGKYDWTPAAHIERGGKCWTTTFIQRQWWKHRIDGLLCLAPNYHYLAASLSTLWLGHCSMLCTV